MIELLNDKDWMIQKYVDELFSANRIAKFLGVGEKRVRNQLAKYGVKFRTLSEASLTRKRVNRKVEKICANCGEKFSRFPSIKTKFCSNECYRNSQEKPVICTCVTCEEPFFAYLSDINAGRNAGQHCSVKCRHKKGRVERICTHCGKTFVEFQSRVNDGKGIYCSKECYNISNKAVGGSVVRNCKTCGREFRVSPYIVDRGFGFFCSRSCSHRGESNPQWVGGHTVEYPPVWNREFRMTIRNRDGFKCGLCGEHGFDVHHIDYNKQNCSPDNLITLCHPCHTKTNSNREKWIKVFSERHP